MLKVATHTLLQCRHQWEEAEIYIFYLFVISWVTPSLLQILQWKGVGRGREARQVRGEQAR